MVREYPSVCAALSGECTAHCLRPLSWLNNWKTLQVCLICECGSSVMCLLRDFVRIFQKDFSCLLLLRQASWNPENIGVYKNNSAILYGSTRTFWIAITCIMVCSLGPQAYCICLLFTCIIFKQGKWMAGLKFVAGDDLLSRRSQASTDSLFHCALCYWWL